jgi:cysteine desulfuration protein SufE
MSSIREIQDEIIEEFQLLEGDREAMLFYLMELGDKMETLDEGYKTEDNIIKGCQSKVWLHSEFKDNHIHFIADSNTDITRGLISLLLRILSDQTPDNIIDADLDFVEKIGMGQIIGSQRSNGFAAMIKQIKMYALGYKAKVSMK